MSDLIQLPSPLADPRSMERYEREQAALIEASRNVARILDQRPDAAHLKQMRGLA